jgi:hypothetical protein
MLLLGGLSLITIFQIVQLLLQRSSHLITLVGTSERIHSSSNREFPCDCSCDPASQPTWRLVDGGVLEDDPVLWRARAGFQCSEERFFCA